ncbi:hypothetical protein Tco_0984191 [Tanacetum coccineum]
MNPELNSEHPVTDILWLVMGEGACFSDIFPFCGMNVLSVGYAGNPNNNNGWLEADDYLLGELEAMADEPMVGPMVNEIAEQMIVPAVEEVAEPMVAAEEPMIAPVIDMKEDLIALFGEDDDFEDDDSEGFDEEEVWELVQKVIQVSDAEVAAAVTIGLIGPRVFAIEGQIQTTVTEMGSQESTLMRCILGLEKRIAALEKRPPGPQ